jgi:predicted HTH domain antitoxin
VSQSHPPHDIDHLADAPVRLEDAMTLFDLRVVSLGVAARLANVSISEFIDALGRAGIPVFQYNPEEVLAEVAELEAQ